jgi:hypothetical protein
MAAITLSAIKIADNTRIIIPKMFKILDAVSIELLINSKSSGTICLRYARPIAESMRDTPITIPSTIAAVSLLKVFHL